MQSAKKITQKMKMFEVMLLFIFDSAYSAVILSILPLKAACESLRDRKASITAKLVRYQKLLQTIAQTKQEARLALATESFGIMSAVRSYCVKNGLTETAQQLATPLGQLKTMAFGKLLLKSQFAIDIIVPLLPRLADYKVTQANIDTWNLKHKTLNDLMGTTTKAYKDRTELGTQIELEMAGTMSFFNNELSPLFGRFNNTNSDLYRAFLSMKRIGLPNVHHNRLIATCVSEMGIPCLNLTVQVDAYTDIKTGKTYDAVSAITNANGVAEIAEFFPGSRTVTISGPGVVAHTFPAIKFANAKAVSKQFELQVSSFIMPEPAPQKTKSASSVNNG